ncbi:MAG: hypothetical protein ACP5D2_04255 [Candidatus Nanoarchaeia archaeon]
MIIIYYNSKNQTKEGCYVKKIDKGLIKLLGLNDNLLDVYR